MNDDDITYLGKLKVGSAGQKEFAPFTLTWNVTIDCVEWRISEGKGINYYELCGALKYVGWNRIETTDSAVPYFECYVHDWPAFKQAMDYLYYELGYQAAFGTYQDSFLNPDVNEVETIWAVKHDS